MASTDYSTYSQAAAQQGYSAYAAQPAQGYAQTTQAYGQQSYAAYRQPTDVSYMQAQTTATNGQTAYATSYGQLPTGYTAPTAPQAYSHSMGVYGQSACGQDHPSSMGVYGQSVCGQDHPRSMGVYGQSVCGQDHPSSMGVYGQSACGQDHPSSMGVYGQSACGQDHPSSMGVYGQSACGQDHPSSMGVYGQSACGQDHPSSMGVYGQESGGFSGPGENWSMSGPDNQGRGRGEFDHGGMIRGGRGGGGGGRGGMRAGEYGGPMEEGPDLDLGPPVDPDEDSKNSAIYVQELNESVTSGVVKMNKRTGQPMINIYLDKETRKPKGDATVSYDDPPTANVAVEWFDGKDFQGSKLRVSLARKKPPMNRPRGSRGNPSGGGNVQHRARDWQCPNPGCGNHNFAWRTECNQCKTPKTEGFLPPPFPPPGGDCGRGGPGGMRSGIGHGPWWAWRYVPRRLRWRQRRLSGRSRHGQRGLCGGRRGGPGGPPGPLMEQMGMAGPERWVKASISRSTETSPTRRRNPTELHLLPDLFFKPENVLNL
uniref:EWS RNA binding protein 1 n=1 Tax=Monodelphis domestica TaxID=13616 RepID=A0A5F8HL97_MONDO